MGEHLQPVEVDKKKRNFIQYYVYRPATPSPKSLKEVMKLLFKPTVIPKRPVAEGRSQ